MAVKGQQAKEALAQELLSYFGSRAFKYDKEIRVNCVEAGEQVQIKIALTAAKVAVNEGGDAAVPGDVVMTPASAEVPQFNATTAETPQVSAVEKHTVNELLAKLGL
jgi:hypothetical protein